jgi:hypothetical protein
MADFLKWFMVIAVVLLAAVSASAQVTNIQCSTSVQPVIIRAGAITESVGEVDLTCVNNFPSVVTVQFVMSLNTTVTNAIDAAATQDTMAAAVIQGPPAIGAPIEQTVQGIVWQTSGNTNNALRFPNVVLPAATTFTVRFVNVRVNALPLNGSYQGTQIFALVTANTTDNSGYSVSFSNQPQEGLNVATVEPTMQFSVTDCAGNALSANIAFQSCGAGGALVSTVYGVTFLELQTTAFKNIIEEDGATIVAGNGLASLTTVPPIPGGPQICDTAHNAAAGPSGKDYAIIQDNPPKIPACTSGAWVSNGTRLLAQFAIPASLIGKVTIQVSQFQTNSTYTNATAQLVTVVNPLGAGNENPFTTSGAVPCSNNANGAQPNPWVTVPINNGLATASWEIISDNLGVFDKLTFAWTLTYTGGPASGTSVPITVSGNMAPMSSDVAPRVLAPSSVASTEDEVVRFNWVPMQTANIGASVQNCMTNLLYPYVTTLAGYFTGIEVANTSLDTAWNLGSPSTEPVAWGTKADPAPFNTAPQTGPCYLYLFGSTVPQNMANGGTAVEAIASALTPPILAGQVFADTLPTIFNLSGNTAPVSGYVIASCQFQYGHGYGFLITGAGAPTGYLALVIPSRTSLDTTTNVNDQFRTPNPFDINFQVAEGEVLSQ